MKKYQTGFTIVELLIVIIVIAILAAISIVAYTGIQDNARTTAAIAAARQASSKLQLYAVENDDNYPTSLSVIDITDSGSTTYQYRVNNGVNPKTWCVTATVGTKSFFVSDDQSNPKEGACAGHGGGGTVAITNLHPNPSVGTNTTGWGVSAAGSAGTNARIATGGPSGVVGTYYQRSTTSVATSSPITIHDVGSGVNAIPVDTSTPYTISVYVRTSCSLSSGIRIDIASYDESGATSATASNGSTVGATAGSWQRLTRTYTAAATTSYIRPYISFSGPTGCPAVSTFAATGFMVTKGSATYGYADGDSMNWIWNGAPHASASSGPAP